jgi:hypothetical protein
VFSASLSESSDTSRSETGKSLVFSISARRSDHGTQPGATIALSPGSRTTSEIVGGADFLD